MPLSLFQFQPPERVGELYENLWASSLTKGTRVNGIGEATEP
jgi:hypothetical protein